MEGIFLQRKEIRSYLDYVIYLDFPKDLRFERLLNRDLYMGSFEDIKSKYEKRYFPAEDKYIEEYSPEKNADYIIKGLDAFT